MYVQVGVGLGVRSGAGFELFACWPFDTAHLVDLELVQAAQAAGIPFRAVVADSLYGEHPEFTRVLWQADLPFVLAVKPSEIVWTLPPSRPLPPEAADRLRWGPRNDAQHPGAWTAVLRRFHDGHEETWWAVDLELGGTYGPQRSHRLVVATSDPRTLPKASTWYLVTNLPLPGTTRAREHLALPAADLAEVVRLYGLRQWVEQGYKQVKQELGWADFQVRSDRAIRRQGRQGRQGRSAVHSVGAALPLPQEPGAGEKWGGSAEPRRPRPLAPHTTVLAPRATIRAELA